MDWKYYNHAILPAAAPKEKIELPVLADELFKKYPSALMIRYTTDIDKYEETQWWHCIKDTKFDISSLKSKHRNVIKNGIKNFDVKVINVTEYIDELYELRLDANKGYDYKISITKEDIRKECEYINSIKTSIVLGAFLKSENSDNGKLCGYLWLNENGKCIELIEQKVIREYERLQVNASLVHYACVLYNDKIDEGYYLYDGERNVVHKTAFQDYLIKYFGFRRAYCKLNIIYNKKIRWIVKILYNMRYIIRPVIKRKDMKLFYNLNGILLLEDILRWQKDEKI